MIREAASASGVSSLVDDPLRAPEAEAPWAASTFSAAVMMFTSSGVLKRVTSSFHL